ncbi:hypothetical protein DPMN_120554 [Dreissena polymorpha]|uniref:Uncharacterized protein n=1 Tax=Dreissena polymorpha TaxID=45954 RepID=A0A9D4GL22_DREPO|nr:hypothetical protein DPMN_120554 [Dreissena polymorpha]
MVQDNPNKVSTVQGKSVQNVRISSNSHQCNFIAIFVHQDGQVMVVDHSNCQTNLLDKQYQVVSHCSLQSYPYDLCQITSSEVAVTVDDQVNTHEIQLITVNKRKLVLGKKLQLQQRCTGIAFQQEELYITADTALYKYTASGKQVSKMYEDT